MTEKGRPRKYTLNVVGRSVAVGLMVYVALFIVVLYGVGEYAGRLWAFTLPNATPVLINQLQDNGRMIVSILFLSILPFWVIGSYLFSRQLASGIRELTDTIEEIEQSQQPDDQKSSDTVEFASTDEIGQIKRMLSSMMGQIRQADVQYRSIVANQRDLIHRWQPDFSITFVNQAFCDFFGQPEVYWLETDPQLLKVMLEQKYPQLAQMISESILDTVTQENPEINAEIYLEMPDGEDEWVQWHTLAMYDRDGDLIELQSIGHVVTDLKSSQLELERLNLQLTQLSQELIQGQEAERASLARFLHDEVLGELGEVVRNPSDHMVDTATIQKIIERVRSRIYMMRSPMLEYGLSMALEDLADTHREIASDDDSGFEFYYKLEASPVRFKPEVETQIFRIVQQACKNAVDHSEATEISCSGEIYAGFIDIIVEDNGVGFDYESEVRATLAFKKHYGLIGMEERCRIIGAVLEIDSAPGEGTRVRVRWEESEWNQHAISSEQAQRLYETPDKYEPPLK